MLEIFFLRWFYRHLADLAEQKERSRAWGALGVAMWIGGEILGFLIGLAGGGTEVSGYGFALGFAAISAGLAYVVVRALPEMAPPEEAPLQF